MGTGLLGAFPHTKKARFESRFKIATIFARVHTGRKKARFESRLFFYACPHTGRKIATQIAPVRASCACVLFVNRQRTQTAERPPCMMGYKKPVRFSFTVLTHFAQKIVAIISNNRDYFQKDALLVIIATFLSPHIKIKIVALIWVALRIATQISATIWVSGNGPNVNMSVNCIFAMSYSLLHLCFVNIYVNCIFWPQEKCDSQFHISGICVRVNVLWIFVNTIFPWKLMFWFICFMGGGGQIILLIVLV